MYSLEKQKVIITNEIKCIQAEALIVLNFQVLDLNGDLYIAVHNI